MKSKTPKAKGAAGRTKRSAGSQQRVVRARKYKISEERILQISNDISEEMCSANGTDLIEVVRYFRDRFDAALQGWISERSRLALDLLDLAHPLLNGKRPNDEASNGTPKT